MADYKTYNAEKQSPPELDKSETLVYRTYKWLFPRWKYCISYFPTTWEFDGKFYRYVDRRVFGMACTQKGAVNRAARRYQRAVRKVHREWGQDQQEYRFESPMPVSDMR